MDTVTELREGGGGAADDGAGAVEHLQPHVLHRGLAVAGVDVVAGGGAGHPEPVDLHGGVDGGEHLKVDIVDTAPALVNCIFTAVPVAAVAQSEPKPSITFLPVRSRLEPELM